jgi:hypothetical protein
MNNVTFNLTNPVTAFIPNNTAMNALTTTYKNQLNTNATERRAFVLNHFVAGIK